MWDGLGAERCPPPLSPPGAAAVVVVVTRCWGGKGSYRMAVNAHSDEGTLFDPNAGLIGSDAYGEYLEWRLKMASSIRAAS